MSTSPNRMTASQYNAIREGGTGGEGQSEAALVADIRRAMNAIGYEVAGIGQHRAKGSGTTVGFPDLAIRREGWGRGVWVMIETKTAKGKPSPAQAEIEARGGSWICRSVAEVAEALLTVEELDTLYRRRLLALLE